VEILPTPGVEEPEPVAVEAAASAPAEAGDAVIERVGAPEFTSETYHQPGSAQTGREVEIAVVEWVAADQMRAEVSEGFRGESPSTPSPYPRSHEATGPEQAGLLPATPAGESVPGQLIEGEPEPAAQAPSPDGALPSESVHQVSEKPANPRRGWWQRLIPS
jgi:hypothetical protein